VLFEAVDTPDQGRLPGPGRAADNNPFLFADGQIDVLQNMKVTKPFMHVDNFNDGLVGQRNFIVLGGLSAHKVSHFSVY
jgi:hypothetical protein